MFYFYLFLGYIFIFQHAYTPAENFGLRQYFCALKPRLRIEQDQKNLTRAWHYGPRDNFHKRIHNFSLRRWTNVPGVDYWKDNEF